MTVLETLPRVPYGVISNRHGKGALPGEYPLDGERVQRLRRGRTTPAPEGLLPLAAGRRAEGLASRSPRSSGSSGVAVAGDERPHSVPPGPHGGNIDINLLTVGVDALPPGAGRRRGRLRRRPALRAGRRRGGAHRAGGLAAGDRPARRRGPRGRRARLRRAGRPAGRDRRATWCRPGWTRTSTAAMRNCVRAAIGLLQARYGMDPSTGLRLPERGHRLRHLAGGRRRQGRARADPQGRLRAGAAHDASTRPAGLWTRSGPTSGR